LKKTGSATKAVSQMASAAFPNAAAASGSLREGGFKDSTLTKRGYIEYRTQQQARATEFRQRAIPSLSSLDIGYWLFEPHLSRAWHARGR
jgi:hypothetical protein